MRQSFAKSARLLSSDQFTQVLSSPEINIHSGPLRLRAITNKMPGARLGLVVGKKGNRLAVRRNRIKRLIRETFRLRSAELPPVDMVVQVFRSVDDQDLIRRLERLFSEVEEHFQHECSK